MHFDLKIVTSILLIVTLTGIRTGVSHSSSLSSCPTWTYLNSRHDCVCGNSLDGIIQCNPRTLQVNIAPYYCMSYDERLNSTTAGNCPYTALETNRVQLPKDPSHLENVLCGKSNREGHLCGNCRENYTHPLYSYRLSCVKCDRLWYSWVAYIAAAYVPLTLFYVLVIVFRISATAPTLNGFVLVSQVVASPTMLRHLYFHNRKPTSKYFIDAGISVYAIWNLDFFRSFYELICVHTRLSTFQVLALDYAVAVYPLLLILITFILVKLHDNFSLVCLWRPFHKCLFLFRRQFNIRSSLVNALATFIILSYIKILNVSFDLLTPSAVYNVYGERVSVYLFYDGTVEMTSRDYLPYLLLAIVMLLVFNIFPLILLTLYPMQCFQKFLSHCCLSINTKLALQAFMDAFQGCFKESPRDCRYFAALYVALRFVHPLLFVIPSFHFYRPIFMTLIVFVLILVVKFQPYKCRRSNMVDTVLLFVMVVGNLAYTEEILTANHSVTNKGIYLLFRNIAGAVAIAMPPTFYLFLIVTKIHSSDCYKKICILKRIKFARSETQAVLVNSNQADYKTF